MRVAGDRASRSERGYGGRTDVFARLHEFTRQAGPTGTYRTIVNETATVSRATARRAT